MIKVTVTFAGESITYLANRLPFGIRQSSLVDIIIEEESEGQKDNSGVYCSCGMFRYQPTSGNCGKCGKPRNPELYLDV